MWREVAINKLKNGSGQLSFKTQREINEEQKKKLEQFQDAWDKIQETNIKFHEVSGTKK